jgi:hypothetical protein
LRLLRLSLGEGKAGSPVAVVTLPARGRPPQAAAGRAGLEVVEKLLTSKARKCSPMRDDGVMSRSRS